MDTRTRPLNKCEPIVNSKLFGTPRTLYDRVCAPLLSEHWAVGIVKAPICAFLDPTFTPAVHWVRTTGRLEYLADCFGVVEGNSRFILAERFDYRDSSQIRPADTAR